MAILNIVLLNLFLALFFDSFENSTIEEDSVFIKGLTFYDDMINGFSKFIAKMLGCIKKAIKFFPVSIDRKL